MKDFQCIRCGNCCRWPGYVKIDGAEIDAIAAYLDMSVNDFLDEYTEVTMDRRGLSLIEKPGGSCVFLIEGELSGCQINPVKPRQCGAFPFQWNFPGWEDECGAGRKRKKENHHE